MIPFRVSLVAALVLLAIGLHPGAPSARGNFEIQVYGSETTPPGSWMLVGLTHDTDGVILTLMLGRRF